MLESMGAIVTLCDGGSEAVKLFRNSITGTYDVIFMDINMPGMDGYEAAGAIRASDHPQAKSVPIIAMTADAFSENVAECLAAGMNGHIAKPIDMKLVMKEIKQIKEESKT
jgi:CheY-like chemotaxis protein